jgi:hypothetical protein
MQTSYSVDRAGTAEQEAEAAKGASSKDISDMAEIVGALAASLPKRARRTREQIEQEKIEKAQRRIEAIKVDQRNRRLLAAQGRIEQAILLLAGDDAINLGFPCSEGCGTECHTGEDLLQQIRAAIQRAVGG